PSVLNHNDCMSLFFKHALRARPAFRSRFNITNYIYLVRNDIAILLVIYINKEKYMLSILFIVLFYFVTNLVGHVVHWILHQKWAGFLNKAHMAHHELLYPPADYLSETYRMPDFKESTPKFFAIAAIPLLLSPVFLF